MTDDAPAKIPLSAAERVRLLMEVKGWSQGELAEQFAVTQPTVSRWLSGKQEPNFAQTLKLIDLVNDGSFQLSSDQRKTIEVSGKIRQDLTFEAWPQEDKRVARLLFDSERGALFGAVIDENVPAFPGMADWIILFGLSRDIENNPNSYYLFKGDDKKLILRQCNPGSRKETRNLYAPGFSPIINSKYPRVYCVISIAAPAKLLPPDQPQRRWFL